MQYTWLQTSDLKAFPCSLEIHGWISRGTSIWWEVETRIHTQIVKNGNVGSAHVQSEGCQSAERFSSSDAIRGAWAQQLHWDRWRSRARQRAGSETKHYINKKALESVSNSRLKSSKFPYQAEKGSIMRLSGGRGKGHRKPLKDKKIKILVGKICLTNLHFDIFTWWLYILLIMLSTAWNTRVLKFRHSIS